MLYWRVRSVLHNCSLFSLENMFKELSTDVENFVTPNHGCLIGWAKQGLLLIG